MAIAQYELNKYMYLVSVLFIRPKAVMADDVDDVSAAEGPTSSHEPVSTISPVL